jgi:Domain of unknown function (DUF3846)
MENIRAMVVEVGNPVLKVVENFEHSLESLQKFVGGYIEAVRVTDSIVIWVNEEGKLEGLEGNFYLTDKNGLPFDTIAGNALFTGSNAEGDTVSLTDEEVEEIKNRFINRGTFIFR